jgi:acyl-CoA dehydrogenase
MAPLVFPLGARRRPASDKEGKEIVRAALEPGAFRDRLTRDIFVTDDPGDRVGLLDYTLVKVVACEEADKKLERAIRKGEVKRFHDNDWIAEAQAKGVLTETEARALAELRDLVARVIAVDDFGAGELARGKAPVAPSGEASSPPSQEQPEHIAAE